MQRLSNKLSREIVRALSKLCLKTTKIDFRGFKFRVPLFHGAGAEYHLISNDFMHFSLKAFIKARPGAIIDIGANIGLYLITLKSLNPEIEYYAFEPNPMCNFYMMELVRLNHFKKVHIFPFALSNKMERAILYAARMGDKMGSLLSHHRDDKRKKDYSFELVTFPGDQFIDWLNIESICAIKIDVEGSEVKVLQGMKQTITKYKPFFFVKS